MPSVTSASARSLRLAELRAALSLATDLANNFPPETAMRTSILAGRLARVLGLAGDELSDVFYLGLMRYIGCTACAQEESAAAVDVVRGRAGTDFDSDLARTYAAESTRLFGETETESAWDTVLEMEPEPLAPGYVPSEITAIHSRFITPPTNNNPIRTQ